MGESQTFSEHSLSKKSTNPIIFRTRFLEILDSFPDTTLCLTDGSKTHNRAGYAYTTGDDKFAPRHRNSSSTLTTELQAIFDCLETTLNLPLSAHSIRCHFSMRSTSRERDLPNNIYVSVLELPRRHHEKVSLRRLPKR